MVSKTASASSVDNTKPVELSCLAQNYDWGIIGSDSLVGRIYEKNSGNNIDQQKPYAEVKSNHFFIIIILFY